MVTRERVIMAYELILNRQPESEDAIKSHLSHPDLSALGRGLIDSPECKDLYSELSPAPAVHEHQIYSGYAPSDLDVFRQFEHYKGPSKPGFVTNFLGCRTRCTLQSALVPFDGTVEGLPVPVGNTQAETAEWIGTLRAVLDAESRFRLLELGAGYGPWMATTHVAATQKGIRDIRVYGVEADAGHMRFIETNMRDNGIDQADFVPMHAAVGTKDGTAYWPVEDEPENVYGGRPMTDTGGKDYMGNVRQKVVEVPVLSIDGLLQREDVWDLVHVDIQGHEGDVCRAGIDEMSRRVRRVVIGTHSRIQDGIVMEAFHQAGWRLENEKPTISRWNEAAPTPEGMAVVDGVQVWQNVEL